MTLTELRYIVAVARERHFGRAADACFVSQPTLSVAVRKLEDELGVQLFERGSHEVSITPAGEQIVTQAQRVLDEAGRITDLAGANRDQLQGPLRVGLIYTIGPYLLPALIPELRKLAPDMPLLIEEGFTADLRRRLVSGDLDVIFVSLPFEEPTVVNKPVYEEPFVVILPAAHPWTQRDRLGPESLAEENVLLLGPGHCFRDQVIEFCPECQRAASAEGNLRLSLEASSLETVRHMVASGLGITVVPATAAGADRYSQRLLAIRRLSEPAPSRTVAVAWRKTFPRPKAVQCVIDAVYACDLSGVQLLDRGLDRGIDPGIDKA